MFPDVKDVVHQIFQELSRNSKMSGEPVVSPESIQKLAEILRIDLVQPSIHSGHVRALKDFLKGVRFDAHDATDRIPLLFERLYAETEKAPSRVGSQILQSSPADGFDIDSFVAGTQYCVDCSSRTGKVYCLVCNDILCTICFERLHRKGSRKFHSTFSLIQCSYSECDKSALLTCSNSGQRICHGCYTGKHMQKFPLEDRKNPLRINYRDLFERVSRPIKVASMTEIDISNDWYQFYDKYGVLFYYNFRTKERSRRDPLGQLNSDDEKSIGDEASDVFDRINKLPNQSHLFPF
jgi:hypothetical protein